MKDRYATLTAEELAIANGAASTELICEMVRQLRDAIANHAEIPEVADSYFTLMSANALLYRANAVLERAECLAGDVVLQEREIRYAASAKH